MIDHGALSAELFDAAARGVPVPLITGRHPGLTWNDARSIATGMDDLRRQAGELQIGWKLGWTSSAMREALGIDQPNWGTLWESQRIGGSLGLSSFIHPKVEPELVWRCPVSLSGNVDASTVADLGGEWALGIEVVDPRFPSFDFEALDNTADNSSSAAVRVGEFAVTDHPLEDLEICFSDETDSRRGPGSQAMGSPWEAIAWLVRALADESGTGLSAGDIVFTGGLTAPFDLRSGRTYTVSSTALPEISLLVD